MVSWPKTVSEIKRRCRFTDLCSINSMKMYFHVCLVGWLIDNTAKSKYLKKANLFTGRFNLLYSMLYLYNFMFVSVISAQMLNYVVCICCSNIGTDDMLYTDKDIENSMDKIETINFHQVCDFYLSLGVWDKPSESIHHWLPR